MWRLRKEHEYRSTLEVKSESIPGVRYEIRKMSVERRSELARELLNVTPKLEFATAGTEAEDGLKATGLIAEVTRIYLRWGLAAVRGLRVDGMPANAEVLLERGPESLCEEIAERIRRECHLSGDERKN